MSFWVAGGKAPQRRTIYHDPKTGLTAMQRCTGFDAAIVAAMMARGEIAAGVAVRELSVDPERYVAELGRRGMEIRRSLR
jgi:saccharopine dehydrogenase-like NADP-dependent oxidoreductase